ncbi:MAG: hypothetical protein Q4B29_00495 [Candidatus Saccharibacteria bacterium]|nr:hypothetical protein [Candidatus Saccharibacteria bacterium]
MPSWNIHLEAGKRLSKKLNYSPAEEKEFLLGNILPDLNNGYLYPVAKIKSHEETHFTPDSQPGVLCESFENFYRQNSDKIKKESPIYLGYLFHLYLDSYYNYSAYQAIGCRKEYDNYPAEKIPEIKRHDFWLYDRNFHHSINIDSEVESEKLVHAASQIFPVETTADELLKIDQKLKDGTNISEKDDNKYLYSSFEGFENLTDRLILDFSKQYLGEDYA